MRNFNLSSFNGENALSRNQMKTVFGGNAELTAACPEGTFSCTCTSDSGSSSGCASSIEQCFASC